MTSNSVFWSNTLDDKWRCYVLLQTDAAGFLRMEDIATGQRVLDVEVPVSRYFRTQDIIAWGDRCMAEARRLEGE